MKNRLLIALFVGVLAISFALGAAGKITVAAEDIVDEGSDRFVGVYITRGYLDLFDHDAYMMDNAEAIFAGDVDPNAADAYQGRLYASLTDDPYTNPETGMTTTTKKYVFEGVEGIAFFCAQYADELGTFWSSGGDERVADTHSSFASTDAGESIALEGTIYISTAAGATDFYMNPVYQTSDGDVYLISGTGLSFGGEVVEGMSSTHEMKEEHKSTVNGETTSVTGAVKLSFTYIDTPNTIKIIQMDADSRLISNTEYAPDEMPGRIDAVSGAQYIVVETYGDKHITRELFQPSDTMLYAFCPDADGICIKKYSDIDWDEGHLDEQVDQL